MRDMRDAKALMNGKDYMFQLAAPVRVVAVGKRLFRIRLLDIRDKSTKAHPLVCL
jgi:hypothetical protein